MIGHAPPLCRECPTRARFLLVEAAGAHVRTVHGAAAVYACDRHRAAAAAVMPEGYRLWVIEHVGSERIREERPR